MRKKRRDKSSPQQQAQAHLAKLGFTNANDYLRWCQCNGFVPVLEKSREDRQSELLQSLTTGPGWRSITATVSGLTVRVAGEAREVEEKIFSGQLTSRHVVDKRYRPLVNAVACLAGPDFDLHQRALRRLFGICQKRDIGLFRYRGRPYAGATGTLAEALARVAMDASHWIRVPEKWDPPRVSHFGCFCDLVSFLYVRHSIPEFLIRSWFHQQPSDRGFSLRVFRHISAGHSIRTLPIGLDYSKRMSNYFLQAPASLAVRQAIRWGQVRGMGGNVTLADAIAHSVLGSTFSNGPFWTTVIDWLIKHPVDDSFIGPIIRYLNNQKFGVGNPIRCIRDHQGRVCRETMPIAQPGLTMKGRTPRSLIRDVSRFQRVVEAHGRLSEYVWAESGIRSFLYQDEQGDVWTLNELLGDGALLQEGQRMKHCVGGYAEDCLNGSSTIWSMCQLTTSGARQRLTVEVEPGTRKIIQARGVGNRLPTELELNVLKEWGRNAGLDWRPIIAQEVI